MLKPIKAFNNFESLTTQDDQKEKEKNVEKPKKEKLPKFTLISV